MNNPYKHTEDNKRYQTWNYYAKNRFGCRVYKVPIDAGLSCPNRDGTVSSGGCVFCDGGSSSQLGSNEDLLKQFDQRRRVFERKWPEGKPLAYFQSYSNTYGDLDTLKKVYSPFMEREDILGLVIATRCDCLDAEKINYLNELAATREIWLELGLQSIHKRTLREMNRGHSYEDFLQVMDQLKDTGIHTSVHIINGWPTETKEMMLETARAVGRMGADAIKIHMLNILKDTPLARQYASEPFSILTKQEYCQIVAEQLTYLRDDIVIERITGDGLPDRLIEPQWIIKKISVINDIDKIMVRDDLWQGKNWQG